MKSIAINMLKFGISVAILAYLFWRVGSEEQFEKLQTQEKNWPLIGVAISVAMVGLVLTIVRWYFLVLAIKIPFGFGEAFRLGFVGYLCNLITLGIVGGDLIKAIFIARKNPTQRGAAATSVLVDRVVGLYGLFLLASVALLVFGQANGVWESQDLRLLTQVTWITTVVATVGLLAIITPWTRAWLPHSLIASIPWVGNPCASVVNAVATYGTRPGVLMTTVLMSVVTHAMVAVATFLLAVALPGNSPSMITHLYVVPVATLANAIPLPGGLGAYEWALERLYQMAPEQVAAGSGLIVALAYRVVTVACAVIGGFYYLADRQSFNAAIKSESAAAQPTP